MPTLNPRVNVTLPPSLDLLVTRLAAFQRVSKSQVLRELLEAAEPALQRATALMEAAAGASDVVKAGLGQALDRGMAVIEESFDHEMTRSEQLLDLVGQAERIEGRRPARRGDARAAPAERVGGNVAGFETPVLLTGGLGTPERAKSKGKPGVRRGRV